MRNAGNAADESALESRLGAALRLIALVGFAEIAAIAIFIASVLALAVGFGAAP